MGPICPVCAAAEGHCSEHANASRMKPAKSCDQGPIRRWVCDECKSHLTVGSTDRLLVRVLDTSSMDAEQIHAERKLAYEWSWP